MIMDEVVLTDWVCHPRSPTSHNAFFSLSFGYMALDWCLLDCLQKYYICASYETMVMGYEEPCESCAQGFIYLMTWHRLAF